MEEEAQQTRTELGPGGTQQIEGVLESEPSEVCAPFKLRNEDVPLL